jgi:hypothetical protein
LQKSTGFSAWGSICREDFGAGMKKIIIFLAIIVFLVLALNLVLFIYVDMNGKRILAQRVKELTGIEPKVASVSLRFPFILEVRNFECGDVVFKRLDLALGTFYPRGPKLTLRKVYVDGLNIRIKKDKEKISFEPMLLPPTTTAPAEIPVSTTETTQKGEFSLRIKKLYTRNALVEFIDLSKDNPIRLLFKDVSLTLRNITYPTQGKINLELNASLEANNIYIKRFVKAEGWVDYPSKDMDVKLALNNADYFAFSEYYPPFWKPESLYVKEAFLSLNSTLKSQSNDLVISGILTLDKIEFFKADTEEGRERVKYVNTVLALLKGQNDKPSLQFRINTKMDDPKLDLSFLKDNLKGIIRIDAGTIMGKIIGDMKGKVLDFKDVISEKSGETKESLKDSLEKSVDKFKDIGRTFKKLFKQKPEETSLPEAQPVETPPANATAEEPANATAE